MESESQRRIISFSNFNPLALLSLILFGIGVILGSVSMGIGQWSRLETDRVDNSIVDGSTFKTQSLLSRCISYDFTRAIVDQGLTLELRPPESDCLPVSEVNCDLASLPLVSALDNFTHRELHNTDSKDNCKDMKVNLQVSAVFVILGIITTFFAMLFYFPLWHLGFYIAGGILALSSVILYSVGIGIFLDQEQDFAGFFSLDGYPHTGCLSYGFGIILAAFIINLIATVVGLASICYKRLSPTKYKYTFNHKND